MEKNDFKEIICLVLLGLVALCVICSIIVPDLLPFYAAGAVLAALGIFITELTR